MKVAELLESPILGARRNLRIAAENWIDTHQGDLAAIMHFVDSGDKRSAYNYLSRQLKDQNLLDMVIATLFDSEVEPTY